MPRKPAALAACVALAACAVLAVPSRSSAAEPTRSVWYGWQTLIVDGSATALLATGVALGRPQGGPPSAAGLFTYALGTPFVHIGHGNVGTGLGSLALRVIVPTLAIVATGGYTPVPGLALAGGMVLIDALALAYADVPEKRPKVAGLRVAPLVSLTQRDTLLGVAGAF